MKITARVNVEMNNLLKNPGWEEEDMSIWAVTASPSAAGHVERQANDARTGAHSFHFWDNKEQRFSVEQTVTGLTPGTYTFSVYLHGGDGGPDADIYAYIKVDGEEIARAPTALSGFRNYSRPTVTAEISGDTLTVGVYLSCGTGGWGAFDDFLLFKE
jgi:arabinogalactan endo-1,4-beta-galactosidase